MCERKIVKLFVKAWPLSFVFKLEFMMFLCIKVNVRRAEPYYDLEIVCRVYLYNIILLLGIFYKSIFLGRSGTNLPGTKL